MTEVPKPLRDRSKPEDAASKRAKIMAQIQGDYLCHGKHRVTRANHKNVMLIGRTRTGKSCIKMLLTDPTKVPDELTLKSGTREPLFESFHAHDNKMVLNIIDTPGLFERGTSEIDIRDNETIMRTIQFCINMEITKFHVICFCIAITNGINAEDIKSLELLIEFLGPELANNSCLIITHCESKAVDQLETYKQELLQDHFFRSIASYFKLGIFFSGSLNRDDYNNGNESLIDQYVTISAYRERLIELFTCLSVEPFPICQMLMNQISSTHDELIKKQLDTAKEKNEEQQQIISQLLDVQDSNRTEIRDLLERFRESVVQGEKAQVEIQNQQHRCEKLLLECGTNMTDKHLMNSSQEK
ncbi:unnamed protein product [Adineta ricciae]|uniref:AIG1-type G domain-containing protein n=1 Tax=Adineta ricciae TaxID=249248 RepID=A0A815G293_ADIRI|nr:unnamed protein product [Adineta ricciae]CAF1332984.1 unnamed protein product [Adineta ricciae]